MKIAPFMLTQFQYPVTITLMMSFFLLKVLNSLNNCIPLQLILHPVSIIKKHEFHRLITGDFVHHDWLHLLFNESLLYIYGGNLEAYLRKVCHTGTLHFICIYLFSCIAGAVTTTIFHRNEFGFTSGGASASIMGCMFSNILLQPRRIALYMPFFGAVDNMYFGLMCIVLLLVYQGRTKNELINYEQHFFGALGGIIITILMFPGIFE